MSHHFTMTGLGLFEIWEGAEPPRLHFSEHDPDEQDWLTMAMWFADEHQHIIPRRDLD
jgi:hypothetical protein